MIPLSPHRTRHATSCSLPASATSLAAERTGHRHRIDGQMRVRAASHLAASRCSSIHAAVVRGSSPAPASRERRAPRPPPTETPRAKRVGSRPRRRGGISTATSRSSANAAWVMRAERSTTSPCSTTRARRIRSAMTLVERGKRPRATCPIRSATWRVEVGRDAARRTPRVNARVDEYRRGDAADLPDLSHDVFDDHVGCRQLRRARCCRSSCSTCRGREALRYSPASRTRRTERSRSSRAVAWPALDSELVLLQPRIDLVKIDVALRLGTEISHRRRGLLSQ